VTTPQPDPLLQYAESMDTAVDKLTATLEGIKADAQHDRGTRRLLLVAIMLDLLVTIATAVIITLTVHSNSVVDVIKDCTSHTGQCYKIGQANTAKTIGQLNTANEAIAVCEAQNPTGGLNTLEQCVNGLLAAAPPSPLPTP
jgi:hypothetical protein